jgi:putative ABC transport system permease protein
VRTLTFKNLWASRRRLVGTLVAITLGVAFVSGTLLLGDTLRVNFDRLFAQANSGTDVVVRSATKISSDERQNTRGAIDASLVAAVRAEAGVADAQPYLEGYGQLIGRTGRAIGGNGPPTRAANWVTDTALNPYRIVAGRPPQADDEVVVNRGAAKSGHLQLGDTTTLLTPQPVRARIVGITTYGTADGFGPSTFTGLTLHAAQRDLTDNPTELTEILVKAAPGIGADELAGRLSRSLPAGVQAITGSQLTSENINDINRGFLVFVRIGLLVFAVIALLVAALSIQNTFSILAAQRGRETALVRALGATRRQVLGGAVTETLGVAIVGTVLGLVAGAGIASALKLMFSGFGFALPTGGLAVRAPSVALAAAAGIIATEAAGMAPALRASRTAPLAALQNVAIEADRGLGQRRRAGMASGAIGIGLVVLAAAGVVSAGLAALGAVLTVVGAVALGPVVARRAAKVLGAPAVALRGITGRLARDNAARNPRRTAATAAALMVGVTVVSFFTVVAASLKASAAHGVDRSLTADLVVDSGGVGGAYSGGRFSPQLAADIASVPGVRVAVGLGAGSALVNGTSHPVTIADPLTLSQVVDFGATDGLLAALGPRSLAVSSHAATTHHWRVGTPVTITYPDGSRVPATVGFVYQHADITGDYLLGQTAWAPHAPQPVDEQVLIGVRSAAGQRAVRTEIAAVAARYGTPKVLDRAQYRRQAAGAVNTVLGIVYVLLVLAIIIALLGIANTLSLSTFERTHELGLLRAVGQTRAQARTMLRWESTIISVLGTVSGVLLGVFVGWALVSASSSPTLDVFAVPAGQLVVFLVVGALAGVVAGIRPARRAARLDVLDAIAVA